MNIEGIKLHARTLRYLRPGQIVARATERIHRARILAYGQRSQDIFLKGNVSQLHFDMQLSPSLVEKLVAERIRKRPVAWSARHPEAIRFVGESLAIGIPPLWREGTLLSRAKDRHLWLFHLHYHDWLWDLWASDWKGSIHACLTDWVEENPLGAEHSFRGPWSPYTISRRLPNWCLLLAMRVLSGNEAAIVSRSLRQQYIYLYEHLEWEHRGNHLLENLIALLFVSRFLDGKLAERIGRKAATMLSSQLREQLLPDGMHHERCPGYHEHLMLRLRELAVLYKGEDSKLEKTLKIAVRKMDRVDRLWRHPDGRLPLLGDTVLGAKPAKAIKQESCFERMDDHFVYGNSDSGDRLLFDAAAAGVDHLGAHMHNDLLGFELSLSGQRIVSDGGGGHYAEGAQRDALRSTREHAGVIVNDIECGEPWKSFRMARRGHPFGQKVRELPAGLLEVEAKHDGFAPLGLVYHRRISIDPGKRLFSFIERLTPVKGSKPAEETYDFQMFVPLFPGLEVRSESEHRHIIVSEERDVAIVELESSLRNLKTEILSGSVYYNFGVAVDRSILSVRSRYSVGSRFSWSIRAL